MDFQNTTFMEVMFTQVSLYFDRTKQELPYRDTSMTKIALKKLSLGSYCYIKYIVHTLILWMTLFLPVKVFFYFYLAQWLCYLFYFHWLYFQADAQQKYVDYVNDLAGKIFIFLISKFTILVSFWWPFLYCAPNIQHLNPQNWIVLEL